MRDIMACWLAWVDEDNINADLPCTGIAGESSPVIPVLPAYKNIFFPPAVNSL